VAAWRVALEARDLGAVSINVRITAVRSLAVEAEDNGLLAPELANGITRVKGVAGAGTREFSACPILATGCRSSKLRSWISALAARKPYGYTSALKNILNVR
jgi:hypothetical protein